MNRLFHSATVRLTTWYVMILTIICLMFSAIVYQITISEVQHRLSSYNSRAEELRPMPPYGQLLGEIRAKELAAARANLIIILFYTNLIVICSGGVGAYFLAKRTLHPIEEAHEQQTRFVSDASHELRTPLATMTTELEAALRDSDLKKSEMKELLESNLEEVQRLTKLSNMLLALSVGNADALQHISFDLTSSVSSIIKRLEHDTVPRITLQAPATPAVVVAHQPSIEELVTILIDNALKYSPPNSPITVAIQAGQKVVFRIANEGEGIAAEHLPKIFDRFYRADPARSSGQGYGLGLSLAQQISNLHGAELTAASTPGKETVFSFSLPTIRKSKAKTQ